MGTELESNFPGNESFHFFFFHLQNYLQIHKSDMGKFNNKTTYNLLYLFRIYKEMEIKNIPLFIKYNDRFHICLYYKYI